MNSLSKKIKFSLPLSLSGLFFLLFLLPISLIASDYQVVFKTSNTSSIINEEIEEEIKSYLTNNSHYPVLIDNDIKYEITNILEESGIIYTFGVLSQNENCLITLFSIDKGWFWTTTDMLYMATDILQPPSPLLFGDICSSAQAALPNRLSNYHVLIQKFEHPKIPDNYQAWSFYNPEEWIDLIIVALPTSDGGTDFAIITPKQ